MLIKNKKRVLHLQKTEGGIQINYFSSKLQKEHNPCFHQVPAAVTETGLSLQQKAKNPALMLLKGTSNFIRLSKLKATISFHGSAKYIIWRYGSSEENGDAERENNFFLSCPYFLSLRIGRLLFHPVPLSLQLSHKSPVPPTALPGLGPGDTRWAAVLRVALLVKAVTPRDEIGASQKAFGDKNSPLSCFWTLWGTRGEKATP